MILTIAERIGSVAGSQQGMLAKRPESEVTPLQLGWGICHACFTNDLILFPSSDTWWALLVSDTGDDGVFICSV